METVELFATRCAICHTEGHAVELYRSNFSLEAFNAAVFSARRLPDRIHYRLVKCKGCGLVRSDPIASPEALARLYAQSRFDYGEEVAHLQKTYSHYLARLEKFGARKGALLEIGCGNGFFLEAALTRGYAAVSGVEPSREALALASPLVRPHIIWDVMRPGLFSPEQFDVICMFQLLDHIPQPDVLLEACFDLLRPGGLLLCLNHDIEALSARVLKERSPIVDLEHTYLYSQKTIARLFTAQCFRVEAVGSVWNRYTLHYLVRLFPFPLSLKSRLLPWLRQTPLGRVPLIAPLGNLYLIARKPPA
jgi:SAM-dependent methyltransferase